MIPFRWKWRRNKRISTQHQCCSCPPNTRKRKERFTSHSPLLHGKTQKAVRQPLQIVELLLWTKEKRKRSDHCTSKTVRHLHVHDKKKREIKHKKRNSRIWYFPVIESEKRIRTHSHQPTNVARNDIKQKRKSWGPKRSMYNKSPFKSQCCVWTH